MFGFPKWRHNAFIVAELFAATEQGRVSMARAAAQRCLAKCVRAIAHAWVGIQVGVLRCVMAVLPRR